VRLKSALMLTSTTAAPGATRPRATSCREMRVRLRSTCVIDALGGVSLHLYARLSRWKRQVALARPEESTGFRVVARLRT